MSRPSISPSIVGVAAVLDAACVAAILYIINNGHLSAAWFIAPLLFSALAFFMANMYANLFEDQDEMEAHENVTFAGHPNEINRPRE